MENHIFTGGVTPARGPNGYKQGCRDWANTYKQRVERQRDKPLAASFTAVFEILKDDGESTSKEQLGMFYRIALGERPDLLVCVSGKRHHIQVLWGGGGG